MNLRRESNPARNTSHAFLILIAGILAVGPAFVQAQSSRKNPASKVYVADLSGDATIDTGEAIEDLTKRSVYTVQGAVIETQKAESEADRNKHFSTMVYSNGTGAFFDADTRVEVKRFVQEPFTPNRTDFDVEPSISQTQAFLSRGTVGLCNSKLVAGSNMTYNTPLGSVNIRGRKVVIEAGNELTKISMLEGESTVRGGAQDTGGHTLKVGEQALIRRSASGQANMVQIRPIPQEEMPKLDDQVAMACMAKKTVYFEVRERVVTTVGPAASTTEVGEATTAAAPPPPPTTDSSSAAGTAAEPTATAAAPVGSTVQTTPTSTVQTTPTAPTVSPTPANRIFGDTAAGSSPSATLPTSSQPFTPVSVFDNNTTKPTTTTTTVVIREIVPVPIVAPTLPTQFTVSPSTIVTRPGR